jgi:hypothetical protein
MKRIIAFILICVCITLGLKAKSTGLRAQGKTPIELEPEKKKRKSPRQGMLRMRSKIFTVNVFRFNKKIRRKHNKEMKALTKYEARLKKRKARKDAKNKAGFQVKIKRRGPSVRQNK